MAIPSTASIYAAVRGKLDDTEVAGGSVYTDTYLSTFLREAWRELFQVMANWGIEQVQRKGYAILTANTKTLIPSGVGLPNLNAPNAIWVAAINVNTTLPTSPLPDTDPANGFWRFQPTSTTGLATGNTAYVLQEARVAPGINREWQISLAAPNVTLLGATVAALPARSPSDYTGAAAGRLVTTSGGWAEVPGPGNGFMYPYGTTSGLGPWHWQMGMLDFASVSSTDLLLQITYQSSCAEIGGGAIGNLDGVLAQDDAEGYLINRTAALAARAKGNQQKAVECDNLAMGPRAGGDPMVMGDGLGGQLKALLTRELGAKQSQPVSKSRFRPKNMSARRTYGWW